MPQLLLHAGPPKTATTTIQTTLFKNHAALLKHGVIYPPLAKLHTLQLATMFKDRPLKHPRLRHQSEAELDQFALESRRALETYFDNPDVQQIILSSESITRFKIHELEKLETWAAHWSEDVKVVVYLRDPVGHTVSVIQENLKLGMPFDKIVTRLQGFVFRMDRILKNLFNVFGKENVIIREFEAAVEKTSGILEDFFEMVHVPQVVKTTITGSTERLNESLSLDAVLSLIHAQRAGDKVDLNMARKNKGRKFDLPLPLKHRIFDETRASVAFIEKETGINRYSYAKDTLTSTVTRSDFA